MPVAHAQPALDFNFTIKSLRLDEDYHPSDSTRITTNFANLARGGTARRTCATP